jgi:hypothetical protein
MAPHGCALLVAVLLTGLLAGCAESGAKSRCLEHVQTDFGNQTKWVPCPAEHPDSPWKQRNR